MGSSRYVDSRGYYSFLSQNCNTLRFLCSEPLSVQWSVWHKGELGLDKHEKEEIVPFNWVNCNVGGAVEDGRRQYCKRDFR